VANVLLRGNSQLQHFEKDHISDPDIASIIKKIHVASDEKMNPRGHTAVDMKILTADGHEYFKKLDIAPGFPGNPLSQDDHEDHFWDCMNYAPLPLKKENAKEILSTVFTLEEVDDVRCLITLMNNKE
jgi:2-methylcitrate dehydratase PrpD